MAESVERQFRRSQRSWVGPAVLAAMNTHAAIETVSLTCIVVIAVKVRQPKRFGRVRMRHVSDVSGTSLVPFVCHVVTPGSAKTASRALVVDQMAENKQSIVLARMVSARIPSMPLRP